MNPIREEQYPIIRRLLRLAGIEIDIANLQVEAMDDGVMGSQRFSSASENSIYGGNVAEVSFLDSDGVYVSGALYVDQVGNPYELDMFKSNFSKLESWPKDEIISDVKRAVSSLPSVAGRTYRAPTAVGVMFSQGTVI